MSKPTIDRFSRLNFDTFHNVDGKEFWETGEIPSLIISEDRIRFHQWIGSDRIDSVANKKLGSPYLWWAIAKMNNIEFIPDDIASADNLRLPSSTDLMFLIEKAKRKNG